MLQVFPHRRALRQAADGGATLDGPLVHAITDASSLYNISGVWVGIGDQYDAGETTMLSGWPLPCVCHPYLPLLLKVPPPAPT